MNTLIIGVSLVEVIVDMQKTTTMNVIHCHQILGVAHHNIRKMTTTISCVHGRHLHQGNK
jgi:hypothetical protein